MSDTITSDKGRKTVAVESHPLAWWISDPLRFDDSGDLMLGFKADDGHTLTSQDYKVEQKMTPIGRLRGHRILQVTTDISALHASVIDGYRFPEGPVAQWKQLLVETDHGNYAEIYRLVSDSAPYEPMRSAVVYGSGNQAFLSTYDPDGGNGGGCADGYWWFDRKGAHEVDFTPLEKAVQDVLPPGSVFTSRCWALHPAERRLESWGQRGDATCNACGLLGKVYADYRIEKGQAVAISVRFVPQADAMPPPAPAIRPLP